MPYIVRKQGGKWVKIKKATGEVISHHASKAKALAAIRAKYANTHEQRTRY